MDSHTKLLIDLESGDVSSKSLIDWAVDQIGNNKKSENLYELAWLIDSEKSEAKELFLRALEELNYSIPSYVERKILLAKRVAAKMIAGEKDINEGCSKLCEISRELDSPSNLSVFELLAHEQYDHESIGINSENIKPSILEEASRLLNET